MTTKDWITLGCYALVSIVGLIYLPYKLWSLDKADQEADGKPEGSHHGHGH